MIKMKLSQAANCLETSFHGEDVQFTGCNTDSRHSCNGELFIALKGEKFNGHDFIKDAQQQGAVAVMIEDEIGTDLPAIKVNNTRIAMGDLAHQWRKNFKIPLVAITGSNGKTTVKEMLTAILKLQAPVLSTRGNLNNDIGVPLTLFGLGSEHQFAVIEMGANHHGEIARLSQIAQPTVAVITQCAPAHLEGFGSIEGVAKAKSEIYENLDASGIAVINADDAFADYWRNKITCLQKFSFGLQQPADVTAHSIKQSNITGKTDFVLSAPSGSIEISLSLLGKHNVLNAITAAACAICLDIDLGLIKQGLENMVAVKGRLQIKPGLNQSRIIDDTYNANPASFDAAIDVLSQFDGERWLVLGDMGELGAETEKLHREVGSRAAQSGIDKLFAFGKFSHASVKAFGKNAQQFNGIENLIENLKTGINPDITLLVKGSRSMQMERIVEALARRD